MPPNKRTFFLTLLIALGLTRAESAELKVGQKFPSLASCQIEGDMSEWPRDKVILVDFWASWCGPCAKSFPAMDELQKTYGPRGLVVIAVNEDKKENMENFLTEHHVTFSILRDASQKLVEKTGISTMPSAFLIDKNGKVVFAHSGFHGAETKKQYEHEIEALLNQEHK